MVKHIKIIQEYYLADAEKKVNEFCNTHNVLDIKNCELKITEKPKEDGEICYIELFNIMIIYEDL